MSATIRTQVLALVAVSLAACTVPTAPINEDAEASIAASIEVDFVPITRCGTVITKPGRYRLMADLIDCRYEAGRPLEIAASNVELDLNRHRIAMTSYNWDDDYGLAIGAVTDVTVRGPGTIEGFAWFGILMDRSTRVTISKVTSRNNVESNLRAADVTELTLHDNAFLNGGYASLSLSGSSMRILYNRITGRLPLPYGERAVQIEPGSTGIDFRGNVIESGPLGIEVGGPGGNTFTANVFLNNGVGLYFPLGSRGNRVIENRFVGNGTDLLDENACGVNFYKGNWFTTAEPSCLQVPRFGR